MNFKDLNDADKKKWADYMFTPIASPDHLKDWIMFFLGLDMPNGHVDPDSNSSPIEAMWEIYNTIKENKGEENPGFIMMSAREGYKTLSSSILETILMLHFQLTIAHMAAIKEQSAKSIQYINYFFSKIEPLLTTRGWVNRSQNKTKIEYRSPEGEDVYIQVIVATLSGANCVDPGSLIFVEGKGDVRACEILPGDRVLTRNYLENKDTFVTSKGVQVTHKSARKIHLENGNSLIVSDDHPILTSSGWIRASMARLGHKMLINDKLGSGSSISTGTLPERNLHQIILGTVLGDSCLQQIPSGKVRYSVFHSHPHLGYLEMIKSEFEKIGIRASIRKDRNGYKLNTVTDDRLIPYRKMMYPNGKKVVTKEWLDQLTPEGIAYWIMDDGCGNPEVVGSRKERNFELATCCFSAAENDLINDYFISLGYSTRVSTVTNQSKVIYPIIDFDLRSSRKMSGSIGKYFIKSLRYKLLSSEEEAVQRWEMDTGKLVSKNYIKQGTFVWSKKPNLKHERELNKSIKGQLSCKIEKIEPLGFMDLVDICIDDPSPTLHSFYCNGILVHNSAHTNLMFIDEIDVVKDPLAYEEAKLIPGYARGIHPVTVKLSTRKFAFGLMQKEIDLAPVSGDKILRWNIIDVTEKCPTKRHQPELPREDLYVAKSLPLRQISAEEYGEMADVEKPKWEVIPQAYAGCNGCKLLSVCKTRLAQRPDSHSKGLFKPIGAVINTFKKTGPDLAEAQLMCFSAGTQVLMGDGTGKNIENVTVGDEVVTHTGLIRKVTETFARDYTGPAYKIDNINWKHFPETFVTPEHPYFINGKEFVSISDVKQFADPLSENDDYLSLPTFYVPNGIQKIRASDLVSDLVNETSEEIELTEGFGRTVGYHLAHGGTLGGQDGIHEVIGTACGYENKKLDSVLLNSNREFLKGLLDGFCLRTGDRQENSHRELRTSNYSLATQLFLIASRLGLCPRITKNTDEGYVIHLDTGKEGRFKVADNYNQYRLGASDSVNYTGRVYNIEVEEDHSYIANGAAVHNCWKPSTKGMVYPRFEGTVNNGNVITLEKAWETLEGDGPRKSRISEIDLLFKMHTLGIRYFAGVDWGYTHDFVIVIFALIPNGEIWIVDCYSAPGLEFSDCLQVSMAYRDKYKVERWFADQAMPSNLKSFTKNHMKCPKFTKDVMGGIEALRSKILDGHGRRLLKVLYTDPCRKIITAFTKHHFKLDAVGNPTLTPDDTPGVSDQADAMRYVAQNLFPIRGTQKPLSTWTDNQGRLIDGSTPEGAILLKEAMQKAEAASQHENQMRGEISRLLDGGAPISGGNGKKGGFSWNI